MVGPGNEIPEWVRCQNVGSGLRIKRPQDLYVNKSVGFVLCCMFVVYKHLPVHSQDWLSKDISYHTYQVRCVVRVDHAAPKSRSITFNEKFGHSISEQLWLLYLSHEEWEKQYIEIELLPGLRTAKDSGLKIKRCGFHPIYEKYLQHLNEIMNQSSGSTSSQDFIGSTMGFVTTRRNLPKYEDEEAEPKGLKMLLL